MKISAMVCCLFTFGFSFSLQAQTPPKWNSCSLIAKLPAEISTDPLVDLQRFEIRNCEPDGDGMVVLAYEKQGATPTLVFATGDGYPRYLAHIFNVLVLQSMRGASDHVYVFAFRKGKPSLALKTATKDLIQVTQSRRAVIVIVPPTTYPDESGKFPPSPPPKRYTFPVEN